MLKVHEGFPADTPKDKDGFPLNTLALLHMDYWLSVLAAPHVYRALQRPVDVSVLLRLLDVWIAYVDRGHHYIADGYPEEGRPAIARELRDRISRWTPPDLPVEITEGARALLSAEGKRRPPRGETWDDFTFNLDEGQTVDSILVWPEGLADVLPKSGA
jgi:hypothetical protein